MPLVSVCIPIYNAQPYVLETIASVRKQTFSDWELVITENGSRDGSHEVVQAELARNPDVRIRYHRYETATGCPADWNRVVRQATGKYVKVLPSDDRLSADCLDLQVRALSANPALGFVTCARRIIDAHGKPRITAHASKSRLLDARDARRLLLSGGQNLIGEPGCGLMRRELVEALGGYDERYRYYPDLELWFRALCSGAAFRLRESLCDFRIHGGGQSAAQRANYLAEYRVLLEQHAESLDVSRFEQNVALMRARAVALARSMVIEWIMRSATVSAQTHT